MKDFVTFLPQNNSFKVILVVPCLVTATLPPHHLFQHYETSVRVKDHSVTFAFTSTYNFSR